jgi:type I restriction-modification system DNA methylase subunit
VVINCLQIVQFSPLLQLPSEVLTHPIAAEFLAALTIDSYDDIVIDPACGSGTLLVAAYRRKQELYQKLYGYKGLRRMHKSFIEKEITGVDIMPFASHISAINLTMQNIEQRTNTVRLATLDSLETADLLRTTEFKRKGIKISPYTTTFQSTLFEISRQPKKVQKKGSVSAQGKGSEFRIKPVDVVIMNPPFSDREKMPEDMRNKLNKNIILGEVCGHQINLWGYFLALADLFLKQKGKMGAVIPINIARGKATEKIKSHILKKHHINYIIKPVADIAFSEGAAFRDILLITEKRKPNLTDKTALILLKKSIKKLSTEEIQHLTQIILESDSNLINEDIEIYWILQKDLIEHKDNLMHFLWCNSIKTIETVKKFFDNIPKNKLTKIKLDWTKEGFHASPAGLSELAFITNPLDESRIKRAFFTLKSKKDNKLQFEIKDSDFQFEVDVEKTLPALRTITAVKQMDIKKSHDYILLNNFKGFDKVLNLCLTKWKKPEAFSWKLVNDKASGKETHLAFSRRFNLYSPNTSLFAFYCDKKFIPPDTLKIFPSFDKDTARFFCLFLNSTINILQMLANKEETTGAYGTIRGTDLVLFHIFDMKKLTDKDKKTLSNLFDKIKKVDFPCILDQLENRFWARVELDKTILNVLGFPEKEINNWLPKIYDTLTSELKIMKRVK